MKDLYLSDLKRALEDNNIENVDAIMEKYTKRYNFGLEFGSSNLLKVCIIVIKIIITTAMTFFCLLGANHVSGCMLRSISH